MAVPATVTYDPATRIAVLDPDTDLAPDTRYVATLTSGIFDPAGQPMTLTRWRFTTGPVPTIVSSIPAPGASAVLPARPVAVTFNEDVRNAGPATIVISDPSGALARCTTYTVSVAGGVLGIRDEAYNLMPSTSWTFTTV